MCGRESIFMFVRSSVCVVARITHSDARGCAPIRIVEYAIIAQGTREAAGVCAQYVEGSSVGACSECAPIWVGDGDRAALVDCRLIVPIVRIYAVCYSTEIGDAIVTFIAINVINGEWMWITPVM
jgi:hypothetical protein